MLITLSRCSAICQSVALVQLTGVAPLGAESHRFFFLLSKLLNFLSAGRYIRNKKNLPLPMAREVAKSFLQIKGNISRHVHKIHKPISWCSDIQRHFLDILTFRTSIPHYITISFYNSLQFLAKILLSIFVTKLDSGTFIIQLKILH